MPIINVDRYEGALGEVDCWISGRHERVQDVFEAPNLGLLSTEEDKGVVHVLDHGTF